MTTKAKRPTRRKSCIVMVATVIALLGSRCSQPTSKDPDVTVIFDRQTEPTVASSFDRAVAPLGATPDGTLYVLVTQGGDESVQVRSRAGSYSPAPREIAGEGIAAMAFDPLSGDPFVLSFPQDRAHIRRFHGNRVVQEVVPTRTGDGTFFKRAKGGLYSDRVDLFYDSSSGSLLYADGDLYRIDAGGAATVVVPRPAPREGGNRVAYAVNPKTGAIYVAFEDPRAPADCRIRHAIYSVDFTGAMIRLAGGLCAKGKHAPERDRVIYGPILGMAVDPASGDLFWWSPVAELHRLSKSEILSVDHLQFGTIRGAVFDAAGNAYVGVGGTVARVTFPKR
jgi:hypothetical protein